jgi:hypothetical protein
MKSKAALQVGISTYINKLGNKIAYTYRHISQDEEGWTDPKDWLPFPFDLVHLKLKDKELHKMGWYTGGRWDGRKVEPEDEVVLWKRSLGED